MNPLLSICFVLPPSVALAADPWADRVVSYDPGSGPIGSFTSPASALGEPTRFTNPGSRFGGAVTPYNPPFGTSEIVSLGAGGSLVVAFDEPVTDDPLNPFGIDLLVFGNALLVGAPVTGVFSEGGLVEVSTDGQIWTPVPGAMADGPFPTLGYSDLPNRTSSTPGAVLTDFTRPVDPAFSLIGRSWSEIVAGYDGSGGGAGIDLAPLGLSQISFVRVSNMLDTTNTPEIDAFADVRPIPSPGTLAVLLPAAILSRPRRSRRRTRCVAAALLASAAAASGAVAALPAYTPVGSFSVPTTQFGTPLPFDVLPDGRLIYADGGSILVQPGLNASGAAPLGSVDPAIGFPFGAAFVRVSPSGDSLALGNNQGGAAGRVAFVDISALTPSGVSPSTVVSTPNFDAEWRDDDRLYVTGASAAGDRVAEIRRSTLGTRDVLSMGGAGAAGITLHEGRLYTGNGFDTGPGPTGTGDVRAFSLLDLDAAAAPIAFETSGLAVADALSAASLGFDPLGNLLVGGGDFAGDLGYAAVIDHEAIAAALTGAGASPDAAELRLSPAGPDFYLIAFNEVSQELLVVAGGTAYRYAIPAPAAAALLGAGGLLVTRRRRRAS